MPRPGCFRCDIEVTCDSENYVYLLGLYLGDGSLAAYPRGVWRLRIFQDNRYVDLIEICVKVMGGISGCRVQLVQKIGCIEVAAYWKHWIHLFPQHAPGAKHTRRIRLQTWQQGMVTANPKAFLAGLIHSDGCRSNNMIKHRTSDAAVRRYVYPRYQFTNASNDIRGLFTDTCDLLGVRWTQTNARNVAVSRRADVEFFDTFIGQKS